MSQFKDVERFHKKFKVPIASKPGFLDSEAFEFRLKFLQEELDEFKKAHNEGDLEDSFDALLDLVYVAYGTAHMMGISDKRWTRGWKEVQRANMTKKRAKKSSESKRGTSLDVIKPEGWTPPNHKDILNMPEEDL